jgi:hypothetical protein
MPTEKRSSVNYLWGVAVTYFLVWLLKSEDPRWWVPIGATLGLGMETRYTMGFLTLGIIGAVLLTSARRFMRSGWLWLAVGTSILVFLPNLTCAWRLMESAVTRRERERSRCSYARQYLRSAPDNSLAASPIAPRPPRSKSSRLVGSDLRSWHRSCADYGATRKQTLLFRWKPPTYAVSCRCHANCDE